jgi:hypothetical protein
VCHAVIHFPYLHAKKGPGKKKCQKGRLLPVALGRKAGSRAGEGGEPALEQAGRTAADDGPLKNGDGPLKDGGDEFEDLVMGEG